MHYLKVCVVILSSLLVLQAVYAVHPTLPLKTLIWTLHLLLDQQVQ